MTTETPNTIVCSDTTVLPAAVKLADMAQDHGWTTQITTSATGATLVISRNGVFGQVVWNRDGDTWRFRKAVIDNERFGIRGVPDRLALQPLAGVVPIRPGADAPPTETAPGIATTPAVAAQLAPAPPTSTDVAMPTGTLASFMAAAPTTAVSGNTPWGQRYAAELRAIITHHGRHSPRNLQVHLGPSELGVQCDRQVTGKLAGLPYTNHVADPWASIVGTAIHTWLADAFKAENERSGIRWVPENRVSPHPDHPGTADLYDGLELAVVDWKNLGETSLAKIVAKGPPIHYQIQLLLYGQGYRNLGLPVNRTVLAALPRTKSSLDGMYVWEKPSSSEDDQVIQEVFTLTALRKRMADDIRNGAVGLMDIPAKPDADICYFCPFYRPQATDGGYGCPGTTTN